MEKKKINWTGKIVIAVLFAVTVLVCLFVPDVHVLLQRIVKMFASGDFTEVREFVGSYGAYAAVVSFLLMILQSVAAPLPAFLITFANASLFGWVKGAILSWSSAMAGAAICFYIARILGRDVAESLTSKAGLQQIDVFFERHGRLSILIARLLPFLSFDIVSYAAGLTSMSFGSFFIATGIGQLPATIIYSYVGSMLTGGAKLLMTGLFILFALSGLIVLLRQVYVEKKEGIMEMKKEIIEERFKKGFDCSQVVLEHYAEKLGITPEMANRIGAGFGGGMGKGETCGAVAGAMIALGMKYGHCQEEHMEQKDIMNGKRDEFLKAFLKKYPGYSCRELLKYDISKPEEMQKILDEGLLFDFCPLLAADVIEILDDMI